MPVEFKDSGDPAALEIVLSRRGATVAGRVFDERGEAVRGARIVIFPADPARWTAIEPGDVAVSSAGEYRTGPRRPGDYLILAVGPGVPPPRHGDRERLARFAAAAERITLTETEQRMLDLRVLARQDP